MYTRLPPKRLIAHPETGTAIPIASTYPVITHWMTEIVLFRSTDIVFMATLTIVESNNGARAPITMIMATLSTSGSSFSF